MTGHVKKIYARSNHRPRLQDPDDATLSFGPRHADLDHRDEGAPHINLGRAQEPDLGFILTSEELETLPDYFEGESGSHRNSS